MFDNWENTDSYFSDTKLGQLWKPKKFIWCETLATRLVELSCIRKFFNFDLLNKC